MDSIQTLVERDHDRLTLNLGSIYRLNNEIVTCVMLIQVGYIDGKELTLACQKEHKVLEYNCDDHRNLDVRSTDKAMASVYSMAAKGYMLPISCATKCPKH